MNNTRKTIHVVRALVKISSALTDMDNVLYDENLKYNLKKDLPVFQKKLENLIKDPSVTLFSADSEVLTHLISIFDDFSDTVFIKNQYITSTNLFLAKLTSACNDLDKINIADAHYIKTLISFIKRFLNKKYLKQFSEWEDSEGNTFHSIIKKLEELTEKHVITK